MYLTRNVLRNNEYRCDAWRWPVLVRLMWLSDCAIGNMCYWLLREAHLLVLVVGVRLAEAGQANELAFPPIPRPALEVIVVALDVAVIARRRLWRRAAKQNATTPS